MNKNNGSAFAWLIPVGLVIGLISLIGKLPDLVLTGGIIMGGLIVLVGVIMFISLKNSNDEAKEKESEAGMDPEDAAVISQARKELTGLRVLNARIREPEVRNASNEICGIMEKVLSALKTEPSRISDARMFLQYYLPTQHSILNKYHQIAESGVAHGDLKEKVMAHLTDIKWEQHNTARRWVAEHQPCVEALMALHGIRH
ncbi:MAG: 5-bromo-4-chloroindolyl phosphate hydrolysis family protein [Lachnospiraceae bacterium]|nr:5-bromo-4-chloroindolyl phosphate hydrolysis family protein [Lachnospiraceae bacterium]